MKSKLDQLERYLQTIIERSANVLWGDERLDLVRKLINAMQIEIDQDSQAAITVPNALAIQLHPKKFALWQSEKELMDSFSAALQEAAVEVGLQMQSRPTIFLEANPDLGEKEVEVHIIRQETQGPRTAIIAAENSIGDSRQNSKPPNAFLIMENGSHFALDRSVINIGRRPNNELSINDLHISREHAQIRLVQENFVVFDLNSTGGTFVNGRKIIQHLLQPGDVISLSGIPLIYVEEKTNTSDTEGEPDGISHTTRISSPSDENQEKI